MITDPIMFANPEKQQVHNLSPNPENVPTNLLHLLGKGLGPVVMETSQAIKQANKEHLNNRSNYEPLTKEDAQIIERKNFDEICIYFIDDENIPNEERQYLKDKLWGRRDKNRQIQPLEDLEFAYFYTLPKVHKKPFTLRPVESGVNSTLEPLSIWLDSQLQKVLHLCPAYLKDSWHFLDIIKNFRRLQPNVILVTVDAKAMYANIPTDHALTVIKLWLDLHKNDLPKKFPVTKILLGLKIIMTQNVFMYGNSFYRQKNGTAMGTSCACAYATIYYSYHEETQLLPMPYLHLYKQLLDDAIAGIENE